MLPKQFVIYLAFACHSLALLTNMLAAKDDANSSFKALTYNIRYLNNRDGEDVWKNRKERVVEVIKTADVIGLQEVVKLQFAYIKDQTPEFHWYGVGRDDGKEGGEMTPIGFRKSKFEALKRDTFWLSPNPQKVGKAGWDAALPRIASWVLLKTKQGDEFYFVNTHFDHRGQLARQESGALLREWVAKNAKAPAILVGDFNAKIEDPPLQRLLGAPPVLRDARTSSNIMDKGPNTTWCGFKELVDGRRIDHIFIAGDVNVSEYETLNPKTSGGRFASDHLPILTKLQLK